MSQSERRHDPYPWTWEPAACVIAILLAVAVIGVQTGRAVANGLTTGDWRYAPSAAWVTSAPAVVGGNASAGLNPQPAQVAAAWVLAICVITSEVVLLAVTVCGLVMGWRRLDPKQPRGFATRAEITRTLSTQRLQMVAPLIRPDLYGSSTSRVREITTDSTPAPTLRWRTDEDGDGTPSLGSIG